MILIAKYDPSAALAIVRELRLANIKVGSSLDDVYVMYKIRPKKFTPEVGVAKTGWIYGVGYDLNRDWSIDIFWKKRWDLKGKPEPNIGLSMRF